MIPPGAIPKDSDPNPAPAPQPDPEPAGDVDPPPLPIPDADPDNDIDAVPPLPADDPDGDPDGDEDVIDPDQFRQEILDEVQRRFDRSISKVVRRMQGQPPSSGGGGDDDPDDGDNPPPAPRRQPAARQVDTRSIRSYARSVLNDAMEGQGRAEKDAVRQILDTVVANTDWNAVDDEEEFVEDLVTRLAGTTQALVKVGSDRKVAQLRASGRLPALKPQPGNAAPPTHSAATGMAQGAETAKRRWPSGKRRMTG